MSDLRKLAEAATPGPWITSPRSETTIVTEKEDEVADCTFPMWTSRRAPTAAFIAAANPQAVIGLLDERDRLHDLVRHQRGPLLDAGLLTDEEYAALAADHGAVGRLETVDGLRASLATVTRERDEARARAAYLEAGLDAIVRVNDGNGRCLSTCASNRAGGEADCDCGYCDAEEPGHFAADLVAGEADLDGALRLDKIVDDYVTERRAALAGAKS